MRSWSLQVDQLETDLEIKHLLPTAGDYFIVVVQKSLGNKFMDSELD